MDGFLEAVLPMLEDEEIRGVVAAGLLAVLTIPAAMVGQLLKMIPDAIMDPERIPAILALGGFVSGAALGYFTPLPMDLSVTIGMGAGLGSHVVHDEHGRRKDR